LKARIGGVKDPIIGNIVAAAKFTSIQMLTKIAKQDRYYSPCYAGKINAVIYPNADVVACEILNDKMGNLRDVNYDFRKIWFSEISKKITDRIIKTKCYCTHECNLLPNVLFNARFSGQILKNFIQLSRSSHSKL
jgi:MoaA/NifB/PqqE/SkfB family radical SAM enzyme